VTEVSTTHHAIFEWTPVLEATSKHKHWRY